MPEILLSEVRFWWRGSKIWTSLGEGNRFWGMIFLNNPRFNSLKKFLWRSIPQNIKCTNRKPRQRGWKKLVMLTISVVFTQWGGKSFSIIPCRKEQTLPFARLRKYLRDIDSPSLGSPFWKKLYGLHWCQGLPIKYEISFVSEKVKSSCPLIMNALAALFGILLEWHWGGLGFESPWLHQAFTDTEIKGKAVARTIMRAWTLVRLQCRSERGLFPEVRLPRLLMEKDKFQGPPIRFLTLSDFYPEVIFLKKDHIIYISIS